MTQGLQLPSEDRSTGEKSRQAASLPAVLTPCSLRWPTSPFLPQSPSGKWLLFDLTEVKSAKPGAPLLLWVSQQCLSGTPEPELLPIKKECVPLWPSLQRRSWQLFHPVVCSHWGNHRQPLRADQYTPKGPHRSMCSIAWAGIFPLFQARSHSKQTQHSLVLLHRP